MKQSNEPLTPPGILHRWAGIGSWFQALLFSFGLFLIIYVGPALFLGLVPPPEGSDAAALENDMAALRLVTNALAYAVLVILGGISFVSLLRAGLRRQGPGRFSLEEIALCGVYCLFVLGFPFWHYADHLL
jgi:hypothetical protein